MSEHQSPGGNINITVSGGVRAPMAVGRDIKQQVVTQRGVTEAEMAELRRLFAAVRAEVAAGAPAARREEAVAKVEELEAAVTAKEPDLTTMEYVWRWFKRNLPKLAGGVTSVVVNPIVGALVTAAGETAAAEFKRRFGAA